MSFDVPILFLVFNRPETTVRVFEKIREIKPQRLFVAADGPREGKEGEKEKCQAVRDLILKNIDWPCEVKTLLRDQNLGCGKAVSSGITWFFEQVDEGIILEDDTLPAISFYNFCKLLLNKYRNEQKIKMISGINFQDGIRRGDASYYFTRLCHIWGWATWKRTWNEYDFDLSTNTRKEVTDTAFGYFGDRRIAEEWGNIYDHLKNKSYDTWDYQLALSIWKNDGINIVPQKNLVSNIGYGRDATHTHLVDPFANIPLESLTDIKYASEIKVDAEADQYSLNKIFPAPKRTLGSIGRSILRKIKNQLT